MSGGLLLCDSMVYFLAAALVGAGAAVLCLLHYFRARKQRA